MRVTSKGQVTIPVEIRRGLGIESGSDVDFVMLPNGVVQLVRDHDESKAGNMRAQAVEEWIKQFSGTADLNGMTVDEYIDWIRGPREDLLPR
jgi:AbrB family looped-hinge helix DNA binding protein